MKLQKDIIIRIFNLYLQGKSYQTINSISSTKRTKGMNLTDPLTIKKVETIWNQELKIAKKEK